MLITLKHTSWPFVPSTLELFVCYDKRIRIYPSGNELQLGILLSISSQEFYWLSSRKRCSCVTLRWKRNASKRLPINNIRIRGSVKSKHVFMSLGKNHKQTSEHFKQPKRPKPATSNAISCYSLCPPVSVTFSIGSFSVFLPHRSRLRTAMDLHRS